MKAFLMYRDRDFDLERELPAHAADLGQDLELQTLLDAMAAGDRFLLQAANAAVLASLDDPEAILYRQAILADCLAQPGVAREIYALACEAMEREKRVSGGFYSVLPDGLLSRSVEVLQMFVGILKRLRQFAEDHRASFRSEGFTTLFEMLITELDDEYFASIEEHLRRLKLKDGILMSADLGTGNHGGNYVLRRRVSKQSWKERIGLPDRPGYVYQIADRDESGMQALAELRGRGTSLVASAVGRSTDHILSFFRMLRAELAFYVGCLNLRERLAEIGEPTCMPEPMGVGTAGLSGRGLVDVSLSLTLGERVVGNDLDADRRHLVMVTGANRGGKSTFLRSVGVAHLMMQCGMFVAADSFRASVCRGVFTHFKREEDATMQSGKLDEELGRMSAIVDELSSQSLVLLNESFASTNEREGSEIARQIVRALLAAGIKVIYVTHLFELAQSLHVEQLPDALFLRAERLADGRRTFRVVEGQPLPTSHGGDLYRRVFGAVLDATPAAADAGLA